VDIRFTEKPSDAPKTMFISKDQWVEEGTKCRLFCEALVGRSNLADARSDLRWRKVWPNGTEGELLSSQTEEKTTREDVEDIIGSYVSFERVSAQDYGTYVCVVHSNDWRALLLGGVAALLLMTSALMLHRRCTPRLLLAARHALLQKEFDVAVCFTAVDGELVRGALLPTLALKYKYRDLPKLKREAKECGERFVEMVRGSRLIPWRHVHDRTFWTALRLALPLPPACLPHHHDKTVPAESEESKNCRSGSLTALV
ncbi:unnamed protein product, partial [Leptidea sinapis]